TSAVKLTSPVLGSIDYFVRIQHACTLQEDLGRFGIGGVGDAAIIDRTDCGALGLVKVPDTFGATFVGDDVDVVADALAITDMVAFPLGVAAGFEDRLVWTFGEAGPAGDALFRDQ